MNFDTTKVVWFGCDKPPNTVYLPHLKFEWNPETFNLLGVEFTTNLHNITDININRKLTEMNNELYQWSKRDLTPFGKITVIKTLIISKIVHILISLPTPSIKIINKINKLLYTFLWSNKPDQIKRNVTILKPNDGGLGMVDLAIFYKSLKLTWLKRFLNCNAKWIVLIETIYPELKNVTNFGDAYIENLNKLIKNPFWENVTRYYIEFYNKKQLESKDEVNEQGFLYNTNIKCRRVTGAELNFYSIKSAQPYEISNWEH